MAAKGVKRKKKELRDMTTPELFVEANKITKKATKGLENITRQVNKLAALVGAHVRRVK